MPDRPRRRLRLPRRRRPLQRPYRTVSPNSRPRALPEPVFRRPLSEDRPPHAGLAQPSRRAPYSNRPPSGAEGAWTWEVTSTSTSSGRPRTCPPIPTPTTPRWPSASTATARPSSSPATRCWPKNSRSSRNPPALKSDVLMMPHHGAFIASTEQFEQAVAPSAVVISRASDPAPRIDQPRRRVLPPPAKNHPLLRNLARRLHPHPPWLPGRRGTSRAVRMPLSLAL